MDHRGLLGTTGAPTIGGVVAANVSRAAPDSGGRGARFPAGGAVRRWRGQVIKNGGRVMKNVTGYDLVKLMAGSFGTLGVLTEVSLQGAARPNSARTSESRARRCQAVARCRALGSPFEVTGAAHVPDGGTGRACAIEGFAGLGRLPRRTVAEALGAVRRWLTTVRRCRIWRDLRDVRRFPGATAMSGASPCSPRTRPDRGRAARLRGESMTGAAVLIWLLVPRGTRPRSRTPLAATVRARDTHSRRGGRRDLSARPAPVAALQAGLRASSTRAAFSTPA